MNIRDFDDKHHTQYAAVLAEGFPALMREFQRHFDQRDLTFVELRPQLDSLQHRPEQLTSGAITDFFSVEGFARLGDMILASAHAFQEEVRRDPRIAETDYPAMILQFSRLFTEWHTYYSENHAWILARYQSLIAVGR